MDLKVDKQLFQPLNQEDGNKDKIVRPSETYWQDAWRRLKQNKVAMVSLFGLCFLIIFVLVVPLIYKYDYITNNMELTSARPGNGHIFGTDNLGRDLLARVLYGSKISLSVGIVSAVINLVIGVIYGGISGYYGGNVDNIMMRIVDIIWSVPVMLYVILLMVVMGSSIVNIYIAFGISFWAGMARIVRGQILTLKEQEFILAARALGARGLRIILRHLVPNSMGPIIVTLTLSIPNAIFTEAFLSFIGLGVSPPQTSLGMLCNEALAGYKSYPYQLVVPAVAICIIMLTFNLLGDGLRDALDPKMRK
jgi:oligopeptide transport system permease protein